MRLAPGLLRRNGAAAGASGGVVDERLHAVARCAALVAGVALASDRSETRSTETPRISARHARLLPPHPHSLHHGDRGASLCPRDAVWSLVSRHGYLVPV